ncbi:MAG: hypothetical protein AAF066_04065 [Pseudomonadota bacterium]
MKRVFAYCLGLGLLFGPPALSDPLAVTGGAVRLTQDLLEKTPGPGRAFLRITPEAPGTAPVLHQNKTTPAHQLLRRLYAAGQAAGNHGDLYDNRDRGHSQLRPPQHPQMSQILYGPELRKAEMDYGLPLVALYDRPVLGNSSTAVRGGKFKRSLPRLALTAYGPEGAQRLFQNYITGQIHVFPEHRDHDPEVGDLYPANTPYYLISQGSSGSDKPHLEALAMILAAFTPDTKAFLMSKGLLAPTVQMVFRRGQAGVRTRSAYLSGAAHPSVFDKSRINLVQMVSLANALHARDVPPMVSLRVIEESFARRERLYDTPAALSRIWRDDTGQHEMVVSAEDTRAPNERALRFEWVLLRGKPEHVRLTPLDEAGLRARIEINWQDPGPVPGVRGLITDRVDIGVFAHNGVHDSAPSFISIQMPRHEIRRYDVAPDGRWRLAERGARPGVKPDPLLFETQ